MANIIEISDLSLPEVSCFARLTEAQLRNRLETRKGIFIAESPKVIRTALETGCKPVSLLMENKWIAGQAADIIDRCGEIPVYTGPRELLAQLTGYELTRGVLCAMLRPAPRDLESVCVDARRVVVLDTIADATNVGAIFRSAAALGFDAVLLTHTCCDPLNRRAIRVSMGTVFQIPWAYIGDDAREWPRPGVDRLHALGFRTAAMALTDQSVSLAAPELQNEERLAVIMGAEGDGLAPATIAASDYVVRIPMCHGVDSLNVAAASAVAFWQLRCKSHE